MGSQKKNIDDIALLLYEALKAAQLADLCGDDYDYEQIEEALQAWERKGLGE